jgi:G patch domain-containing protein 1
MLGETPLPSAPRSVFEFMSQKDRERLQNVASNVRQPAQGDDSASSSIPPPGVPPLPDTIRIARTEPHIAQAALRGFQPFATDPTKKARYKVYLESQAAQDSSAPPLKPTPGQRIDEFNKEVEDYAKAALLFKPMSGAMAGRFTSAAVIDHGPKIHEGLHTPSIEEMEKKEEEERKKVEENISPKAHAAKMSMYGPLTREVKPWQPEKLLCKRFGVKDPNPPPETPTDAPPAAGATASDSDWQEPNAQASTSTSTSAFESTGTRKGGPKDSSNVGLGEDEDQGRDTLTYERPTMDVFKAIFASDDEDSDDEDEDAKDPDENIADATIPLPQAKAVDQVSSVASITAVAPPSQTPVDLSTFKPTFIPRDKKANNLKDKDKDKKEKRKKERKAVLVSFEMDEEGGMEPSPRPAKGRPKKKKRRDRDNGDDDDAMWVEKPASDAVKSLPISHPPPQPSTTASVAVAQEVDITGPLRGRKRAVDFM